MKLNNFMLVPVKRLYFILCLTLVVSFFSYAIDDDTQSKDIFCKKRGETCYRTTGCFHKFCKKYDTDNKTCLKFCYVSSCDDFDLMGEESCYIPPKKAKKVFW